MDTVVSSSMFDLQWTMAHVHYLYPLFIFLSLLLRTTYSFYLHSFILKGASDSSTILMSTPTEAMSDVVSEALGRKVELVSTQGGGGSGGGGATTSAVVDKISGDKYFVKTARNKFDMLMAEYLGVKKMADTNTIQVPTPIAFGEHKKTGQAFCVFEYLEFCGGGNQFELGAKLAKVRIKGKEKAYSYLGRF